MRTLKLVPLLFAAMTLESVQAVQYVITATNVSDGDSDQVVVDNTGAVTGGNSIATIGYFRTIADGDVGTTSVASLISDFESLASEDFSTSGAGFNGLFSINTTIDPAETNTEAVNGNGKSLYLFLGNGATLAASSYVGLVDTGENTPDVTSTASSFSTDVDYSVGKFGNGGLVVLGQITADSVAWGGGNSTGTFELVAIPEPSSVALLGLGGLAVLLRRRR